MKDEDRYRMTTLIEELFRQNTWANGRLLEVCEQLSEEQLEASAPGTYGKIKEILQHIVGAQQRYVSRLQEQPPDQLEEQPFVGFDDLKRRATSTGEELLRLASENLTEPVQVEFRGSKYLLDPKVVLVQVINHSTEHREQVKATLSQLGIEAPNLDGWTYGATAGLFKELS